jgi:hypothetical protein
VAGLGGREGEGAGAAVQHHEIVAGAVHFEEFLAG